MGASFLGSVLGGPLGGVIGNAMHGSNRTELHVHEVREPIQQLPVNACRLNPKLCRLKLF